MIYCHKLNLGFNNPNLVSFSSFTFASWDMKNIYICLSFLYHYLHNPLPETDTKPRALPFVSMSNLGMNVIHEPPVYFNVFTSNIFFSYHSIIQNSLYLQISQFFIFHLLFPHPLISSMFSTSLTHLPLNPRAAPSSSSFCSCQVLFNRLPPEPISFCSHHGYHLALPNSQIHMDLPAFIFPSCPFIH